MKVPGPIRLFFCGDVMTGRGIDQILRVPSDPTLHESWVRDAKGYVELAETMSGPIPRRVEPDYIWGDALAAFERLRPDFRIINLETTITTSEKYVPKGINYRMHPDNIDCLKAAAIDCCVLSNNHILDWDARGLLETLATLERAGIRTAGAGRNRLEAARPAILGPTDGSRVLVFGVGFESSGIPRDWAAKEGSPGLYLFESPRALARVVREFKRPGDLAIASLHWGGNWGYGVSMEERRLAHALISEAAIDLVHGHSSHHPRGMELYRRKLILYGCGDLINDYEGIEGYEEYRNDLGVLYFPTLDSRDGSLLGLELAPTQLHRFRLRRPSREDSDWLLGVLEREMRGFGQAPARKALAWAA